MYVLIVRANSWGQKFSRSFVSHSEHLIFSSLLLSGRFCSSGTLRKKKKEVIQKGGKLMNEWVTPAEQSERRNLGFRVCIWIYLGESRGNSESRCVFETSFPVGAPEALRSSRAQCSPSWMRHTQEHRPICHTPPGCLQHDGSAAHRTPGSGCRPPASSLWGLWLPLGRN